ncbi:cilia- and flagella-associated protein 91-like [Ostrinia furnacalis]|uniref:cilia- and flagella-associated protein 91-like n=1 Tax=Ostrinia furnacalis TaxID=93504 RepID=UPI00103D232A|nr:cilia- and flagella-associated protein 91-like [Ostrinia furnacalis]
MKYTWDILSDSAFIVSGARDYARTAFKAAMASAQVIIQPVYKTMFSEMKRAPRMHVVYHANCRLPDHMDRSYSGYLQRVQDSKNVPAPQLQGRDRFMFTAIPKKLLPVHSTTPDFHPPSPRNASVMATKPRSRGTQSLFRESSAQTIPWQPDGKPAETCENTPEVLYLDQLEWGPGSPYRIGDLPADFHTTEIINKMRHARAWMELVEKAQFPRWMKKRNAIITDVETKDWIFREAEIDELQDIRLTLLHRMQAQQRQKATNRTSTKLAKLWACKKQEMERKVDHIRRSRDRELRKLTALHTGGGRPGLVQRMRASRGSGSMTLAAHDPTSDLHAPLARHGYQARRRHADIDYDPTLLSLEDHKRIAEPPAWLDQCGQNLKRTCSGHHLPRDPMQLCERETKWSEQFLENLHNDLKKARLGAAQSTAGPLHVLKPRRVTVTPRPPTPEVESVEDSEEASHQAALLLQKIIRGRAVQNLMYEGRTRASELTEELKTTHGLQKEDKIRIAREEAKAREYNALRTESEQKDDAISALVDELCGGAVSAALDFLEKELKRLKEERRQHAYILIALREKAMREAAEAGRRQKEEHRRREHDEMFKQVLGVTQETVDAYLREIIDEGVALAAEEDAVKKARSEADKIDLSLKENDSMSTAEQNELVAELVQQFLLPEVHKTAARHRISAAQNAKLEAARRTIFGHLDEAEIKEGFCTQCGCPLDELCRCRVCPLRQEPVETKARFDPRWVHSRSRPRPPERSISERFPPDYEFRRMLDTLVDEAVLESRARMSSEAAIQRFCARGVRERIEITLDSQEFVAELFDRATGAWSPPPRSGEYHHFMMRVVEDALERSVPFDQHTKCK